MPIMKVSTKGLNHLIKLEGGFKLKMYNDLGAKKGHCTIGIGHLIHKGICTGVNPSEKTFKNGISTIQGKNLLKNDLRIAEKAINRRVAVQLTQNQFDALVSFVFNVGSTKFRSSTLLKLINSKQIKKAANEFQKWNKVTVGSKIIIVPGLRNRRISEKHLFEKVTP